MKPKPHASTESGNAKESGKQWVASGEKDKSGAFVGCPGNGMEGEGPSLNDEETEQNGKNGCRVRGDFAPRQGEQSSHAQGIRNEHARESDERAAGRREVRDECYGRAKEMPQLDALDFPSESECDGGVRKLVDCTLEISSDEGGGGQEEEPTDSLHADRFGQGFIKERLESAREDRRGQMLK